MYAYVTVPIAAYRPLALRHRWLLQVLVGFADATGKCWPALRTVAAEAGHHVSWVQRNMAELVELGHLTRRRRGRGSFVYQIAERFLRPRHREQARASRETQTDSAQGKILGDSGKEKNTNEINASNPHPRSVKSVYSHEDPSAPMSRRQTLKNAPVGTEGLPREESEEDFKREDAPVRLAPPDVAPPWSDDQKRPARPAGGANPHARRQWLRTLNSFIGERLRGPQQWGGWEVVTKAMNGDPLAPEEKRSLDGLDRMMRGCGYARSLRPTATWPDRTGAI